MTTRRYGDDEIREIFSLATTGGTQGQPISAESDGMTLDELQRIGEEAGIEPTRVAQAAAMLDARGKPAPIKRSFGLPIGVSRVVDLPRAPTDREWEQLISEFRTTFGSLGRATSSGGLRQWTQGELHISVEPTEHGEQLRLTTRNGLGDLLSAVGVVTGGMSVLSSAVVAASGDPKKALLVLGMFGGMSLAAFGSNLLRLPRWARTRQQQMEALAEHTVRLLSKPQVGPP